MMDNKYFRGLAGAAGVWAAAALGFAAPPPASAAAAADHPALPPVALGDAQLAAFHDYLQAAWKKSGLPGLAVALVQPQRVLLLDAFGVRALGADANVTADTRFALGAATQPFNSLLLARLADQRVLDLDAPARRCWDDFKLANADATRVVSLRELLEDRGGVSDEVDKALRPPHATPADLFAALAQLAVAASPGDADVPSAASPAAAGYLAVLATQHPPAPDDHLPEAYSALARTQLLDPLGMTRATFAPPAPDGGDDAAGHTRGPDNLWHPALRDPAPGGALLPALGLRASARDLAAWLRLEVSGGIAPGGPRLLSDFGVRQRWEQTQPGPGRQYSLGWDHRTYRGQEILFARGETDNQSVLIFIIPKYGTAAAVLINAAGRAPADLQEDIELNLADLLRETAEPAAPAEPAPAGR